HNPHPRSPDAFILRVPGGERSRFLSLRLRWPVMLLAAVSVLTIVPQSAFAQKSPPTKSAGAAAASPPAAQAPAPPVAPPAEQNRFANPDYIVRDALSAGNAPGAVLIVGHDGQVVYRKAFGNRALQPKPEPMTVDTVFDVASLTKVMATTMCVMR